jgi:steroid 5-alpha reductase family enzyme
VPTVFDVLLATFVISLCAITCCWVYGLCHNDDMSLIDGYYGAGSLVHGVVTFAVWHQHTVRGALLAAAAGLWAIGLSQSMARRWWRMRAEGGDQRYRDVSAQFGLDGKGFWWKSWLAHALGQSVLIALLNLPLQLAIMTNASGLSVLDVLGLATVVAAGSIEVVSNRQLELFKRGPRRPGATLMTGLWAWSRHPNYFGNTMVYVGCWLVAMRDASLWWTVVSPLTALFVLRFILGVRMTDELMLKKRAGDPEYLDYVRRTPAFVMKPPRWVEQRAGQVGI